MSLSPLGRSPTSTEVTGGWGPGGGRRESTTSAPDRVERWEVR